MSLISRPPAAAGTPSPRPQGSADPKQVADKLVRRINPGPTWTVDQFVVAEARRRRRPILLVESDSLISITAGVTGQLWTREHADEIVLPPGLGRDERRYAIAHEMGHLLLNHPTRATPDAWAAWYDALPPALVRRRVAAFTCEVHSDLPPVITDTLAGAEQEAEWFASLLLAQVDHRRDRIAARRGADRTNQMLDRLAQTFGLY